MKNSRFSFGNLFDQSEISNISYSPSQNKSQKQSQQSYKQKYFQCKQNIKKFMSMVQKEFQTITQKHNTQTQSLQKQITRLKYKLNQKHNQVSNFTVRSKQSFHTNQKNSNQNRSMSQENNQIGIISFEGIQRIQHSKVHNRSKSIVDKNLSTLSTPNTLFELQNVLNQTKNLRIDSKKSLAIGNVTQDDIKYDSLNLNQYSYQFIEQRKKRKQAPIKKQNFDVLMEKMLLKNTLNQNEGQKNGKKLQKNNLIQKNEFNLAKNNKENIQNSQNNKSDRQIKAQQTSVRNILKNLRNTMKTNIQKESNLQAPTTLIVKN